MKDPYKSQLKLHLEDLLPSLWLEGYGTVEVQLNKNPRLRGATDAVFYEVDSRIKFVLKFGLNDVPGEKEGYKILRDASPSLKKHLVPLIGETKDVEDLGLNKAILLTPYINSLTLHEIVCQGVAPHKWLFGLYSNFLNELGLLWQQTSTASGPCLEDIYLKRLNSRFETFKKSLGYEDGSQIEIVVNGKEKRIEREIIPTIQEKILRLGNEVKHSCVIHGDEHAKNVLVKRSAIGVATESWVLIDCSNARVAGDWIFSIAKILHWWKVYSGIENSMAKRDLPGRITIRKERIEIEYDDSFLKKRIPKRCGELYDKTLDFCQEMNRRIFQEKDSVWKERLRIALFILLFGAVTRHLEPEKRFAIPTLLGESFKLLGEI